MVRKVDSFWAFTATCEKVTRANDREAWQVVGEGARTSLYSTVHYEDGKMVGVCESQESWRQDDKQPSIITNGHAKFIASATGNVSSSDIILKLFQSAHRFATKLTRWCKPSLMFVSSRIMGILRNSQSLLASQTKRSAWRSSTAKATSYQDLKSPALSKGPCSANAN